MSNGLPCRPGRRWRKKMGRRGSWRSAPRRRPWEAPGAAARGRRPSRRRSASPLATWRSPGGDPVGPAPNRPSNANAACRAASGQPGCLGSGQYQPHFDWRGARRSWLILGTDLLVDVGPLATAMAWWFERKSDAGRAGFHTRHARGRCSRPLRSGRPFTGQCVLRTGHVWVRLDDLAQFLGGRTHIDVSSGLAEATIPGMPKRDGGAHPTLARSSSRKCSSSLTPWFTS